jgi:hypothetical protein
VTAAAHWIASQGGKVPITDAHENEWLLAFADLISAICRDNVNFDLVGRARQSGKYESVPAIYLNDRPGEYEFLSTSERNPRLSEAPDAKEFLKFSFSFSDQDWRGRHNDKLFVAGLPEWTHLQVNMTAVAASWPFDLAPRPAVSSDFISTDEAVDQIAAAIAARDSDKWLGPLSTPVRKPGKNSSTRPAVSPQSRRAIGQSSVKQFEGWY